MNTKLDLLYKNQSSIYKYVIYVLAVFLIVVFFPKGGKFKYEFQKGKPWQYESLYAPFDFSVVKSDEDLSLERQLIIDNQIPYYQFNDSVVKAINQRISNNTSGFLTTNPFYLSDSISYKNTLIEVLDSVYSKGVVRRTDLTKQLNLNIIRNNRSEVVSKNKVLTLQTVYDYISEKLTQKGLSAHLGDYQDVFVELIMPNLSYDKTLTQLEIDDNLSKISKTRGYVDKGKLIIARGEVVESENFKVLNSLKSEYESELWSTSNYFYILGGYTILVALVLMMLMLFLIKYRPLIFKDNTKVTFVIVNVILMVLITSFIVKFQLNYLFVVPLCILPIILKTFFDARLGLYIHVLTVLILGFVVPNSFEFIFLQIIAGIVTILSVSEMYKRANLFISVAQITGIYILSYIAFHTIQEGNLNNIELSVIALFVLNGMITLFAQPLIYIYEKIFGLISDVSLLELSDTNSKLLKEMSNKAPGTFNHSLQVANLAEAAANEIGANAMLVRVGALYHDIGKMLNPMYFTENQVGSVNPHNELDPEDSAEIIINHVIEGIELAKKNKLPDRLIDFIRTHHGTTKVYYFYKKAQELDESIDPKKFTYPGPLPFSKETAILMMADSIEAASKSLKNPTYDELDKFVEKIVNGQMAQDQFSNASITFKEIQDVKKVLKKRLVNIFHLRIEYPD